MPNDPFVDVGDLPSLGPLRYLDVRDQAAFDAAHAPGATRVPLDEWDAVAKAVDAGFAKAAYWDNALGALEIAATVTAVAYDSGGMTNAARVWFILQYYGLKAADFEWRLACPCVGDRTAAGSRGVFGRLPGGAGVRIGWSGRPGALRSAPRSLACIRYADARGVHRRGRARSRAKRPNLPAQPAPSGCGGGIMVAITQYPGLEIAAVFAREWDASMAGA